MKQVNFGTIKCGEKFRDTFYSNDWCIKCNSDTARSLEHNYSMVYSIPHNCPVEVALPETKK